MEQDKRPAVSTIGRFVVLAIVLSSWVLAACVTQSVPYRVSDTWYDSSMEEQTPLVRINGVDSEGWLHLRVNAGPVTGPGATVEVTEVVVREGAVLISLHYIEPAPRKAEMRTVAWLEVELPRKQLPARLAGTSLLVDGQPIDIRVSEHDAVQLVRAELATTTLGLGPNVLDRLEPVTLLLVRDRPGDGEQLRWQWYVELAPSAGTAPRVYASIDASTGETTDLTVEK